MNIFVALDDRDGMLFHGRRQSRDRVMQEDLLNIAEGQVLWMNAYTAALFPDAEHDPRIRISEHIPECVGSGEYCFVENVPLADVRDRIERLIIYRWNRRYPGDTFFDLDLHDGTFTLAAQDEVQGFSHAQMIREEYRHE